LNVLSFSYCFPNAGRPTWGVFVHRRLAALARREDVSLQVVSPVPGLGLATFFRRQCEPVQDRWEGLTVHRPRFFRIPGVFQSSHARWYARGLERWLERFIGSWHPDILDAHFIWPDGVGVARLAGRRGLPYAITLRGKIYPCLEVPSQRRQCAEALRGAAAVISVDARMAQIARDLGAPPERVSVIPNGVDLDDFKPGNKQAARGRLGLPEDGRLLVSVAHLGVRKGHRETIEAVASLPGDVHLVLVGTDAPGCRDAGVLRRLVEDLRLADRVIFAGPQPHERIPDFFIAADASVLASYREGCPNAVLESLACGTPVVATPAGAVPEMVVPGRNGAIVPMKDPAALAEAISAVLGRTWDPREVAGTVQSWDEVAARVVGVFQHALASPGSS